MRILPISGSYLLHGYKFGSEIYIVYKHFEQNKITQIYFSLNFKLFEKLNLSVSHVTHLKYFFFNEQGSDLVQDRDP